MKIHKAAKPTLSLLLLLLATGHAPSVLATPLQPAGRADRSRDGTLYCGNFATGSRDTARGLLTDLDAGAGGKISGRRFAVAPGACRRVHCWDTTGVYVCNDASHHLTLSGNDVWAAANDVFKNCCWGSRGDDNDSGLSGQKFVREGGRDYNVVVGYGNCNHEAGSRPSGEGGGGINRACDGGVLNPLQSSF